MQYRARSIVHGGVRIRLVRGLCISRCSCWFQTGFSRFVFAMLWNPFQWIFSENEWQLWRLIFQLERWVNEEWISVLNTTLIEAARMVYDGARNKHEKGKTNRRLVVWFMKWLLETFTSIFINQHTRNASWPKMICHFFLSIVSITLFHIGKPREI